MVILTEKQATELAGKAYEKALTKNMMRSWDIDSAASYYQRSEAWYRTLGFTVSYNYLLNSKIGLLEVLSLGVVIESVSLNLSHIKVYNEHLAKGLLMAKLLKDTEVSDDLEHTVSPDSVVAGQVVEVTYDSQHKYMVSIEQPSEDSTVFLDVYKKDGDMIDLSVPFDKELITIVEDTYALY